MLTLTCLWTLHPKVSLFWWCFNSLLHISSIVVHSCFKGFISIDLGAAYHHCSNMFFTVSKTYSIWNKKCSNKYVSFYIPHHLIFSESRPLPEGPWGGGGWSGTWPLSVCWNHLQRAELLLCRLHLLLLLRPAHLLPVRKHYTPKGSKKVWFSFFFK